MNKRIMSNFRGGSRILSTAMNTLSVVLSAFGDWGGGGGGGGGRTPHPPPPPESAPERSSVERLVASLALT